MTIRTRIRKLATVPDLRGNLGEQSLASSMGSELEPPPRMSSSGRCSGYPHPAPAARQPALRKPPTWRR